MLVKLICVGKIKENYLVSGISEYLKRIKPFCDLVIYEVKEMNTNDINKNIIEEGNLILTNIKNDDFVITLELDGKNISSVELSDLISNHHTYNNSNITFVIGGSDGLSIDVKNKSNYKLSFGKMTYPHQLMRMILLEQIYRAFMIANNKKYHK